MISFKVAALLRNASTQLKLASSLGAGIVAALLRNASTQLKLASSLGAGLAEQGRHYGAATLILLLALTSCRHRDFCYDHNDHAPRTDVVVEASYQQIWEMPFENLTDWRRDFPPEAVTGSKLTYDSLIPPTPEGLRIMVYPMAPGATPEEYNIAPFGAKVRLTQGNLQMLFYNNDTEYIQFLDLGDYESAVATTRSRSRPSYKGNSLYRSASSRAEQTVNQPDMLYGHYIDPYQCRPTVVPDTIHVPMRPLVWTYFIHVGFVGEEIGQVSAIRGALAGMARGVRLDSGHTTKEEATVLFDGEVTRREGVCLCRSFGIPDFPNPEYSDSRADLSFALNIEVMTRSGRLLSFDFDVTSQVARQPHGGVIYVGDLAIPDDPGEGQGGGFDVDVNAWGDYQDIPLPF